MEYIPQIMLGVTILSAVWGHALWLSNRFAGISKEMDVRFERIFGAINEKLEYHERHDDKRFNDITNGLWEIRLQNAVSSRIYARKKKEDVISREGGPSEGV